MRILIVPVFVLSVWVQGCATSAEKSVNAKLAAEPVPSSRTELQNSATQSIQDSTAITPEQKQKLITLKKTTTEQIDQANQESLKMRSLLVQEILGPKYNAKEVVVLKRKVRAAEGKRVDAMLNAIDQANKILGRQTVPAEQVRILHNFADTKDF